MFTTDILKKYSRKKITLFLLIMFLSILFISLAHSQISLLIDGIIELRGYEILIFNLGLGALVGFRNSLSINESWTLITPVMMVLSAIFLLLNMSIIGIYLSVAASMLLYFLTIRQLQLEMELGNLIQVFGAASLFIGNVLFEQGYPIDELIVWWFGFPILLICGDKLLINDYGAKKKLPFLASLSFMWLSGAVLTHILQASGWVVVFYILLIQTLYLIKKELLTIRAKGIHSFSSLIAMVSYFWLAIGSIFGLYFKYPGGSNFEVVLIEMIFLGFVLNNLVAYWAEWYSTSTDPPVIFSEYLLIPFVSSQISLIAHVVGKVWDIPMLVMVGSYGIIVSILILFVGLLLSSIKSLFNGGPVFFFRRN